MFIFISESIHGAHVKFDNTTITLAYMSAATLGQFCQTSNYVHNTPFTLQGI